MKTRWRYLLATLILVLAVAAARAGSFTDEQSRYHSTPARAFDIEHRDLHIRFDHAKRAVHGTMTLSGAATDSLSVLELHGEDLVLEKVTGSGGVPLEFTTGDGSIWLRFSRPLARGEKASVTITYHATPRRGLYFIEPDRDHPGRRREVWSQGEDEGNRYWFPDFDKPNERAATDIWVTVGRGEAVVSNGKLVETQEGKDATRTFHYRMDVPHPSYLVSVAAGTFAKVDTLWRGKPVEYFVPPDRVERVRRSLGRTPEMLEFFSEITRTPYPYEKYAQVVVQDFSYGGMENISATTMTERLLLDATAFRERNQESLIAHELAHQWFGDYVGFREWAHTWLSEGFATFFENLWQEHAWGRDQYDEHLREDRESYLAEARGRYQRPIVSRVYTYPSDLFDRHAYPKGAWVLHMLRRQLGDARFFAGIHEYLSRHAGQSVDTDQFRLAMEQSSGEGLEQFFDQWLYHAGQPDLKIKTEWLEGAKLERIRVEQVQPSDSLVPVFAFDLPVRLFYPEAQTDQVVKMRERVGEVLVPSPQRPLWVELDPDMTTLFSTSSFDRSVEELIRQLSSSPRAVFRGEAATALGEKAESDSAIAALAHALRTDRFYAVRQAAAAALGKIRREPALDALVAGAGDKDARVRRSVATALGGFSGEPRAEQAALAATRDPAYGVVAEGLGSLARLRSSGARATLLAALERPSWGNSIAAAAASGLGELGDVSAIPRLQRETRDDRPVDKRTAATRALGNLGRWLPREPQSGRSSRRDVREVLEPLLWDENLRMRQAAAAGLANLGDPAAIAALTRSEARDAETVVQREAHNAIVSLRREGDAELRELRQKVDDAQGRVKALEARVKLLEEALKKK